MKTLQQRQCQKACYTVANMKKIQKPIGPITSLNNNHTELCEPQNINVRDHPFKSGNEKGLPSMADLVGKKNCSTFTMQ